MRKATYARLEGLPQARPPQGGPERKRSPGKRVAQRHASRISQGMNGRAEKSTVPKEDIPRNQFCVPLPGKSV